ncbi:MAG: ribonuclease H-like domain-containing protein [Lachnospiraceae bacterium]|nr:ribonuclease H-like domain-containing protein [Lachnospiraceae bacterium]
MITIEKQLQLPNTYPLERIGRLSELLFFDIETTGFSGDYSNLYLIGCTYCREGAWHLIQWFADTADSEADILHEFFHFLEQYQILIHFNGDGFDIPYLMKRCRKLGLPYDFSKVTSIDIYRRIKPYRSFLGLESMKQKAIEQFLGVSRTDCYSGGQLIEVYHDYLMTHEPFLYDLLILHNEDDLKGMPAILPILNYPDFLEHPFRLAGQTITEEVDLFGDHHPQLSLVCESDYEVPVSFDSNHAPVSCTVEGNQMTLTIDLYEGTLKHFYPNYKDYYYLIYEDTAVHKSIGEYVGKDARTRATAKTCYTKKDGCFLPQFSPLWEPVLKQEPKDRISYVDLKDACLQDPACFRAYLTQLLQHLGVKQPVL